jgi:uncharacterized SAM-binding protein YcdF (DUF218 family)
MDLALFIAKKLVTLLFYPLGTSLLFLLSGLFICFVRPRSRTGLLLMSIGTLWLVIMSCPVTGMVLLERLENHAGSYAVPEELTRKHVKYIVVLGGDMRTGDLTPADRVACSSLVRVLEGIRLWKGIPGARLVLSGGSPSPRLMTSGHAMASLAVQQGVAASSILVESQSLDTGDEARLLKAVLGSEPFALVTTASHMRRSLMNFRSYGMNPIPAPADFQTKGVAPGTRAFLPQTGGLELSQKAIHEYLGIWVLLIRQCVFS